MTAQTRRRSDNEEVLEVMLLFCAGGDSGSGVGDQSSFT